MNVQKEMLQVAEEINEIKKRKDIVEKIVGSKKKNDSDVRTLLATSSNELSDAFTRIRSHLSNLCICFSHCIFQLL